jgi:HAE1 family hydrophobic/amphiphilic exporter-1
MNHEPQDPSPEEGHRINPIARFAVERRVTMGMIVLGVLVLGWVSLQRLPLEFLPTFSSSHMWVWAPYPSASPEETERKIVRPLEDSLGTINGIQTLSARASADSGNVSIEFEDGVDMDLAAVEVRDRVDRVRNLLPADLRRVYVRRFQSEDIPVLSFHLTSDWSKDRLQRFVEEVLQRHLERLEGVAQVEINGLDAAQVRVDLSPSRLQSHGIAFRLVAQTLRQGNVTLSGGYIREGPRRLNHNDRRTIGDSLWALHGARALPPGGKGSGGGTAASL